jgi:hypothetical protein
MVRVIYPLQVVMHVSDDEVAIDQPFELALKYIKVYQEQHSITGGSCTLLVVNKVITVTDGQLWIASAGSFDRSQLVCSFCV